MSVAAVLWLSSGIVLLRIGEPPELKPAGAESWSSADWFGCPVAPGLCGLSASATPAGDSATNAVIKGWQDDGPFHGITPDLAWATCDTLDHPQSVHAGEHIL